MEMVELGAPLVMVIDDDAEMRAVLRDYLTRERFSVCEEPSGERVITTLESVRPDVIVLDKEMPGTNGLDLLSYIGRRFPRIPVILVTAFGGQGVRAEALRRGAASYIEKPFRVAALLDTLRAVTERRAALETRDG
ncbi:MAG: response regulator [Candidatus Rokubacteria bacterium]|nr:response regulator [Candidatus Rokubacteria bacterium]